MIHQIEVRIVLRRKNENGSYATINECCLAECVLDVPDENVFNDE
jgi:hypothetical protein